MAFDADLTSPALIERFEPYFKHPDPDRYVLRMGDRAVACKNAKTALAKLGFARVFGNDPELYDSELAEAVGRKRSAPAVCDHPDFCPTLPCCMRAGACGAAAFRHLDETGPDDPDVYTTPVTLALGIRAERCDRRGLTRAHTADASAVHTTLRGGEAPMGSRRGPIRHSDATTPSRRQGKVTVAHRFTAHLVDKRNYPSFLGHTGGRA